VGSAVEDIGGKEHDMMSDNQKGDFAAVGDRFSAAPAAASNDMLAENSAAEFNDDSPLKWLVPLIITALLVALGFLFCGGKTGDHANAATNAALIKTFII
jgi:hypothetical protein